MAYKQLTEKQRKFAQIVLRDPDLSAAAAYRAAGFTCKNQTVAGTEGHRLLRHPKIREFLDVHREARAKRVAKTTGIDGLAIVEELTRIHQADHDELSSYWRTACRYCWSFGYGYKRSPEEYKRALAQHAFDVAANAEKEPKDRKKIPPFEPMGGDDFDCLADPDPNCTECRGLGVGTAVIKDTRKLSRGARALYAGIQQTKDGIKVLTHSKEGFTTLLMRHSGMLIDKREVSGPGGGPVPLAGMTLPTDPIEAAKLYADIMGAVK
jgi:phage terminase small subunit